MRGALDFAIDGGVVKVDALALWPDLGVVGGREPRYAIARKFAPDIAETTLRAIEVNVGRTGTINPYAVLEPVEIGGTTVKLATLHNFDLVARKDLRVGDIVQVKRAGDVIPQIIGPVPDKRDPKHPPEPYVPPTHCPSCGTALVPGAELGHAVLPELRVPGPAAREPRALRVARRDGHSRTVVRAHHAARRRGSGARRRRPLRPRAAQLVELERLAEKSAEQLVAAIEASKAQPLSRLLFGLGIEHVGETVGEADRPALRHDGRDRRGDGRRRARGPRHRRDDRASRSSRGSPTKGARARSSGFAERGLTFDEPQTQTGGALKGLTVVITGTLPTLSRERGVGARRVERRPRVEQRVEEDELRRRGRGRRQQAGEGAHARRRDDRRSRAASRAIARIT